MAPLDPVLTTSGAKSVGEELAVASTMTESQRSKQANMQSKAEKVLMEIVDLNPRDENDRADITSSKTEASLMMLIALGGDVFTKKTKFTKSGWNTYPLVMLCALGASSDVLKEAYDAYPPAVVYVAPLAVENKVGYESLRKLVESCPGCLAQQDEKGHTVLHCAVAMNAPLDMIRYLVTKCPEAMKLTTTAHGWTPLHIGSRSKTHGPVVKLLLELDASILQVEALNGNDPFLLACKHHSPDLIDYIITKHPDVLGKRYFSAEWPALHMSVYNGASLDVVKLLVSKEPGQVKLRDKEGRTLLHLAVEGKKRGEPVTLNLIDYLIRQYPDAQEIADNNGSLPMDMGVYREMVHFLQDNTSFQDDAPGGSGGASGTAAGDATATVGGSTKASSPIPEDPKGNDIGSMSRTATPSNNKDDEVRDDSGPLLANDQQCMDPKSTETHLETFYSMIPMCQCGSGSMS